MSLAGAITRAAAAVAPRLSFPAAAAVGRGLGSVVWALDKRHRDVAVNNLAVAFPDMPESRRLQLALAAFRQAGRTAVETLWSASLDGDNLPTVASFDGLEHLRPALDAGHGVVMVTAHFGNWELMGVAMAQIGVPISVIARRIDDPEVDSVLNGLRTRTGAAVLYKEEAVRSALRVLRDGQAVGVLIDQNTIPTQASFVPFFGRLAATTRIAAQLHARTGAPIVMVFCIPEGERYRFVLEPLDTTGFEIGDEQAVEALTAAATRQIEHHIRRNPQAWLWIHDRWRTTPPDQLAGHPTPADPAGLTDSVDEDGSPGPGSDR